MNDYLVHHGILGQKWGVRRFQNPDGTLTDAGKKRYATALNKIETRYGTHKGYRDNRKIKEDPILADLKNVLDSKAKEINDDGEIENELKKIDKELAEWFREQAIAESDPSEKEYYLTSALEYEKHKGPRDYPDYDRVYAKKYEQIAKAGEEYMNNVLGDYSMQKAKGFNRSASETAIKLAFNLYKR